MEWVDPYCKDNFILLLRWGSSVVQVFLGSITRETTPNTEKSSFDRRR